MKNLFKKTMLLAAAAMAFAQCSTDTTEDVISTSGVSVSIEASTSDITRSAFGDYNATDKTYPTLWEGNESWFGAIGNSNAKKISDITFAADKKSANVTAELNEPQAASTYKLYAISPADAHVSYLADDNFRFDIESTQTPTATSCDPAAQVLIAQSEAKESFSSFDLSFKHATAYAKFSFINLELGNATVNNITIQAETPIVGRFSYAFENGAITAVSGSNIITLATSATENLWFACAPANVSGTKLIFTISTSNGPLTKEVTMPANSEFKPGVVANFNVDMSGIKFAESVKWELVTNVSSLAVGDQIIIAAKDYNYALSTTQNDKNRGQAAITKSGNYITDPSAAVQIIEVKNGSASGTFALYVEGTATGYLYAAGGTGKNNYLKTSATLNTTSSWNITIASTGVATIKSADTNVARHTIFYNQSSSLFSCYASGQKEIVIYKKTTGGSEGGDTPDTPATPELTVTPATVEVAATGGNGEFGYTVANMDDDITASTTTEWITGVSASNGKVTYSVAANYSGTARSGNIVLTSASADISKSVAVSQAADVFEVSVTEISLGADSGATAKFTVKSTYAFTLTSPDDDKIGLSTDSGQGELEITVTALTSNGSSGELSRGNIRITRSGDNKTKEVTVKQKAAGAAEPILETAEVAGTTGTKSSDGNSISWDFENFTITNVKGSTAIRTSDSDHYRVYQGSTLTFTAKNGKKFTKIVITCTGSSYATAMKNTLGDAATVSGSTVTWTGSATTVSKTLTAQSRFSKVVATLE